MWVGKIAASGRRCVTPHSPDIDQNILLKKKHNFLVASNLNEVHGKGLSTEFGRSRFSFVTLNQSVFLGMF